MQSGRELLEKSIQEKWRQLLVLKVQIQFMKILIINGPNLNLLEKRQPELYGGKSFEEYLKSLHGKFPGVTLEYFQSNHAGQLIDRLLFAGDTSDGIVLNAGGYSHTSVALADAVAAIKTPVVEVHITNIYAREVFRQHSLISRYSKGVIAGLGLPGYEFAIAFLTGVQKK